jgi:tRNA modification GTPase
MPARDVRTRRQDALAHDTPTDRSTIAAAVTAPGRGALAVIAVHGPDALDAVSQNIGRDPDVLARRAATRRLWVGPWRSPHGEPVVVHARGSDSVEISCHGGPMAVERILADLAAAGARSASPLEFAHRTTATSIAAEALVALAEAPTARTAGILLTQYNGALVDASRQIQDMLRQGRASDAVWMLETLLERAAVGLHLVTPWRVAIVGRPNVGKSSLLNAIVGFDRAIVHPTPGTTRDLVTATTAIDGWPVELIDSAGLRATVDDIESAGIERTRRAIEQSDAQLVVLDRSRPLTEGDQAIMRTCPRAIVVANKCDLAPAWSPDDWLRATQNQSHPNTVSAATGVGLVSLIDAVGCQLVPQPPDPSVAVPFTPRHVATLQSATDLARANAINPAVAALDEVVRREM